MAAHLSYEDTFTTHRSLQEEAILKSAPMLQFVLAIEGVVQILQIQTDRKALSILHERDRGPTQCVPSCTAACVSRLLHPPEVIIKAS